MNETDVLSSSPLREDPSSARLAEALAELSRLQELGEDWDLDGARPIDHETIQIASGFVRSVAEAAREQGVAWEVSEVGPVPDGSVALTWEGTGRQTLMIFRPRPSTGVECVTRKEGAKPVRHVVPESEAVPLALWALGGK